MRPDSEWDPKSAALTATAVAPLHRTSSRLSLGRGLQSDCRGTVGPISAVMFLIVLLSMGSAIDFGRWQHARSEAQIALSAAVTAGSRMLQITSGNREAALGAARQAFDRNLTRHLTFSLEALDFEVSQDGATVTARGTGWLQTLFLGVIGIDRLPILGGADGDREMGQAVARATSGASVGTSYEVALALDLSERTGGIWLESLQLAVHDLVDIVVRPSSGEATTRVGIVPYADAVNVGEILHRVAGEVRPGLCATPGCLRFIFHPRRSSDCSGGTHDLSPFGNRCEVRIFLAGDCVAGRSGAEAHTDASPMRAPVDLAYPNALGRCPRGPDLVPLSGDKESLKAASARLQAGGASAPQVGIAWAWYLLSPEWGSLWPMRSQPAPYRDLDVRHSNGLPKLRKIAVLLHGGDEVVQHCQGVDDRLINCVAPNGRSAQQTRQICTGMRRSGITIYVVSMMSLADREMEETLRDHCAGRDAFHYEVHSGDQLRQAFRDIALEISTLVETL